MTFEEFQTSKVRVEDCSAMWGGDTDGKLPAFVYCPSYDQKGDLEGGFVILENGANDFSLIIGNSEWNGADLAVLERTLWDEFAEAETNSDEPMEGNPETRAELEGTDASDERAADEDAALRAKE